MSSQPVLIRDPGLARAYRARRKRLGLDKFDEVWEGVIVVPTLPNTEHQKLVHRLEFALAAVIDEARGDLVLPGLNISSSETEWKKDFRIPDVVVCLAGGLAKDRNTHWYGGPDLAVEIASPDDDPREKLAFYGKIGTRELLVIDRDPWGLELYQLRDGKLASVGRSEEANPAVLASGVLPLTFVVRSAAPRPAIVVAHTVTAQSWTA